MNGDGDGGMSGGDGGRARRHCVSHGEALHFFSIILKNYTASQLKISIARVAGARKYRELSNENWRMRACRK